MILRGYNRIWLMPPLWLNADINMNLCHKKYDLWCRGLLSCRFPFINDLIDNYMLGAKHFEYLAD